MHQDNIFNKCVDLDQINYGSRENAVETDISLCIHMKINWDSNQRELQHHHPAILDFCTFCSTQVLHVLSA